MTTGKNYIIFSCLFPALIVCIEQQNYFIKDIKCAFPIIEHDKCEQNFGTIILFSSNIKV